MIRAAKWLAGSALVLAALYLGGMHLALNTSLVSSLVNRGPGKLSIEWDGGHSLRPGWVTIRGLQLRGRSRTMQWQCTVDSFRFRIELLSLLSATVRVREGQGSGFTFHSLSGAGDGGPDTVDPPPLSGPEGPPAAPPRGGHRRRWTIDLDDIVLSGPIELWMDRLEIEGHGVVAGSMDLEVGGDLAIPAARFELADTGVVWASSTLVQGARLDVETRLSPLSPKTTRGAEVLRHFTGRVSLRDGTVPDLSVLNPFFPGGAGLELLSGRGDVDLVIESETAGGGSSGHADFRFAEARTRFRGSELFGSIAVEARLARGDLAEGVFEIGGSQVSLEGVRTADAAQAGEEPWWGYLTIPEGRVDLGSPSSFDVGLRFRLRDTRPILKVFASKEDAKGRRKLPLPLRLVPNVRDVEGRGTVSVAGEAILINDVDITGDGIEVKARMSIADEIAGDLFVRYRGVGLGVELDGGEKDFKLRRPLRWFESRPRLRGAGDS